MAVFVTSICWCVVAVVWIVGAAMGVRGSSGRRRAPEGGVAWRLGAGIAAIVALHFAAGDLGHVTDHSPWLELPGLILLLGSTGFTIWARVRLGRMWSASPNVLQADHRLRTDGPYAVTRHPIYSGLLGMLIGTVFLNGLGVSLAFLILGAAFLASRIPVEERLMSKTFPEEYALYRERVPRLVPWPQALRRSGRAPSAT